jgi:hypothetical protein
MGNGGAFVVAAFMLLILSALSGIGWAIFWILKNMHDGSKYRELLELAEAEEILAVPAGNPVGRQWKLTYAAKKGQTKTVTIIAESEGVALLLAIRKHTDINPRTVKSLEPA